MYGVEDMLVGWCAYVLLRLTVLAVSLSSCGVALIAFATVAAARDNESSASCLN